MRESRNAYVVLVGRTEEKSHMEDVGVDGRIILKCILKKWDGGILTAMILLRMGTGGGLL
jgi:hypothetical protein